MISAWSRISRRMSPPRIASASSVSAASTVAERSSSSNIASSPKMSPGPNVRERDLAAVRMGADRARVTAADDVARVRGVADAEHGLSGLEPPRHGDRCDGRQLVRAELPERRHLRQQSGSVVGACWHRAGIPHGRAGWPPGAARVTSGPRRDRVTPRRARARGGAGGERSVTPAASTAIRASGSAIASAISATPAATSSTRSASCAASPGVQPPSSSAPAPRRCGRRPA